MLVRLFIVNLFRCRRGGRRGRHGAVAVAVQVVPRHFQIHRQPVAHQVDVHQRGFAGVPGGVGKDNAADQDEVRPYEREVTLNNTGTAPRRDRSELG